VSDKIINNSDNFEIKSLSYGKISAILCVIYFLFLHFICLYFYSTTNHEIIQIKKIIIYYVVWTRLTRVGCFNWLAHFKLMGIANKK